MNLNKVHYYYCFYVTNIYIIKYNYIFTKIIKQKIPMLNRSQIFHNM